QHFPQEPTYRRSLAEESEALTAAIEILERLRSHIDTAELVSENESLLLLVHLYEAGVLEPYLLIRLGDEDIAKDYPAYRASHREKLEAYLDKFVVPSAPAKTDSTGQQAKPRTEKSSGTAKPGKAQVSK